MTTFALIGAAGYVAPRHIQAIADVGGDLVAAVDPHDSVGILDAHFPDCHFFTEIERFDRHLDKLRREGVGVDYVAICSPNHLHDAHVRLALRNRAHAICEKPVAVNPWNLAALQELEEETGLRVWTVHQLRHLPVLQELRESLIAERAIQPPGHRSQVRLAYVTPRGRWYDWSWKGDDAKSGTILANIGIHFFDLLCWFFGTASEAHLIRFSPRFAEGTLILEHAEVTFHLSLSHDDLPPGETLSWRSLTIDGEEIEFSPGFRNLHTEVYRAALCGKGYTLEDASGPIELIHRLRAGT